MSLISHEETIVKANGEIIEKTLKPKIEPEREFVAKDKWEKDIEFLLSCIALSVGLGNVWRFPFTALGESLSEFVKRSSLILLFLDRKWRRRLRFAIPNRVDVGGKAALLHGTAARAVFIARLHQSLRFCASNARSRRRSSAIDLLRHDLLCFADGFDCPIFSGILQRSIALERVQGRVECFVH